MSQADYRPPLLPCGCRQNASPRSSCRDPYSHHRVGSRPEKIFETDIDRANNLITEWGRIAISIARQCKWRPRGQCCIDCQGLAVCNLDGLSFVDAAGHPVARPEAQP